MLPPQFPIHLVSLTVLPIPTPLSHPALPLLSPSLRSPEKTGSVELCHRRLRAGKVQRQALGRGWVWLPQTPSLIRLVSHPQRPKKKHRTESHLSRVTDREGRVRCSVRLTKPQDAPLTSGEATTIHPVLVPTRLLQNPLGDSPARTPPGSARVLQVSAPPKGRSKRGEAAAFPTRCSAP